MDRSNKEYFSLFGMMQEWYEAREKDMNDDSDFDGYLEWKLGYPHPINRK